MNWPLAALWILAIAAGLWELWVYCRRTRSGHYQRGYRAGYDAALKDISKGVDLAEQDAGQDSPGGMPVQGP